MRILPLLFLTISLSPLMAQDTISPADYYYSIEETPEDYSAGSLLGRTVDALGFRYYWATEGLRAEDLAHRPTPEARDVTETLRHILTLSELVRSAARQEPFQNPTGIDSLSYADLRATTLARLEEAGQLFTGLPADSIARRPLLFAQPDGSVNEVPVFTLIHGPLTDAIYHVGQITTLRRAAGNPMRRGVSMFRGGFREPE